MGLLRIRLFGRFRLSSILLFLLLSALFIFILNSQTNKKEHIEEDILNPKYLQQQASYRRKIASKFHFDQDDAPVQMCKVPKLSLKSDVNQFAFHSMEKLECTEQELFTLKDYMLKIKPNVLKDRKLDRCIYKAIEWETDSDSRFSENMERKAPGPFQLKIKNEFFHVECYLEKTNETQNKETSKEQKYQYVGDGRRRLLQANDEKRQAKWRVASDQAINQVVQGGNWNQKRIKDIVQKVQSQQNWAYRTSGPNPFLSTLGFVNSNENLAQQQQTPQGKQNHGGLLQRTSQEQQFYGGLQQQQQTPQRQQNYGGLQQHQQALQRQQNYGGQQEQTPQRQQNYVGAQQQQRTPQRQQNYGGARQQQQTPQRQQNYGGLQQHQQALQRQQNYGGQQEQTPQRQQNYVGAQQQQRTPQRQQNYGGARQQQQTPQRQQNYGGLQQHQQALQRQQNYGGQQQQEQTPQRQQNYVGAQQQQRTPQRQQNYGGARQQQQTLQRQQNYVGAQQQQPTPQRQQHYGGQQQQEQTPQRQQNYGGQQQQGQTRQRQQNFGGAQQQEQTPQRQQNYVGAQQQEQTHTGKKQSKYPNSIEVIKEKQDQDKSIDLTQVTKSNKPNANEDEAELKELPATSKEEVGAITAEEGDKGSETDNKPADADSTDYPEYQYPDFNSYYRADGADFEQFFAQIVPKEDVIKRVREVEKNSTEQMNVLIFAMDSMSHLTYQRKLPKTYEYIQEKLGSVVLNGYNIVGDATTAAIIPMTTGRTELELPEVRKNKEGSTYVDAYPLIWNKFEQRGYVTLYTEDKPDIAVFNLRLNGFEEIPTDHYMRPFYQAVLKSSVKDASESYCTGGIPSHVYMLDYLKQLFERYPADVNKFAFGFLSDLSHDDNNPAEYIDQALVDFFESLRHGRHLDNTVVILMGDHGARYSAVRKTTQGKLEERLPMMSLAFPPWFQKKYPNLMEHLRTNADRLTTPFDIHATLLSIVDLNTIQKPIKNGVRGRSLLRPHPLNRTCSDAGVDAHWCTCMNWQLIDPGNIRVQRAAAVLMEYINAQSKDHRDICSRLTLKEVTDVKIGLPNEKVLKYLQSADGDQRVANFTNDLKSDLFYLQVIIETVPGHGLYEGTLTLSDKGETYKVVPGISRINKYGSQAHCVTKNHPDLRIYCHCTAPPPNFQHSQPWGHRDGRTGSGLNKQRDRS